MVAISDRASTLRSIDPALTTPEWEADAVRKTIADLSTALRSAQDDNSKGVNGEERQLTAGGANETSGRFSPDGKWVSYTSDVGGSSQIWLAPWDEAKGELGREAATEKLSGKAEMGRELDRICRPEVILATNSSSISITKLA